MLQNSSAVTKMLMWHKFAERAQPPPPCSTAPCLCCICNKNNLTWYLVCPDSQIPFQRSNYSILRNVSYNLMPNVWSAPSGPFSQIQPHYSYSVYIDVCYMHSKNDIFVSCLLILLAIYMLCQQLLSTRHSWKTVRPHNGTIKGSVDTVHSSLQL